MPTATASLKADFSELIASIKQMPTTTKAETKRMVAAMRKAQREMTKQAKAQAKAQKAAANQTGDAWVAAFQRQAEAARKEAQAAALPGMTAQGALGVSREQMDDLSKQAGKLSKAQDGVARSSSKMQRGFSAVAMQAPDLWTQIAAGGDPLVAIQQQGLQVVQQMGDVGGQLKAVAGFMTGPWALAAAVAVAAGISLANAYHSATDEARNLQASIEQAQAAIDPAVINSATAAWERFTGAMEGARVESLEAAGEISSTQLATSDQIEMMRAAGRERLRLTAQEFAQLEMERQLLNQQREANTANFAESQAIEDRLTQLRELIPLAKARIADRRAAIAVGIEGVNMLGAEKVATEQADQAERDLTEAISESTRAREEREAVVAAEASAFAAARNMAIQSASDLYSKETQLQHALSAQLAMIGALQSEYEEGSAVFVAAEEAKRQAIARTRRDQDGAAEDRREDAEKEIEEAAKNAKKLADIAELEAKKQAAFDLHVSQSKIALAATTAGALGSMATDLAGDSARAQLKAWRFSQAAAMAEAALNTALAISEASTSAPPPYNLIPMASAAIQGAALEVAIASSPPPQAYEGISVANSASTGTVTPIVTHPGEEAHVFNRSEVERGRRGTTTITRVEIRGRAVAVATAREVRNGGSLAAQIQRRALRAGRSEPYR